MSKINSLFDEFMEAFLVELDKRDYDVEIITIIVRSGEGEDQVTVGRVELETNRRDPERIAEVIAKRLQWSIELGEKELADK